MELHRSSGPLTWEMGGELLSSLAARNSLRGGPLVQGGVCGDMLVVVGGWNILS